MTTFGQWAARLGIPSIKSQNNINKIYKWASKPFEVMIETSVLRSSSETPLPMKKRDLSLYSFFNWLHCFEQHLYLPSYSCFQRWARLTSQKQWVVNKISSSVVGCVLQGPVQRPTLPLYGMKSQRRVPQKGIAWDRVLVYGPMMTRQATYVLLKIEKSSKNEN